MVDNIVPDVVQYGPAFRVESLIIRSRTLNCSRQINVFFADFPCNPLGTQVYNDVKSTQFTLIEWHYNAICPLDSRPRYIIAIYYEVATLQFYIYCGKSRYGSSKLRIKNKLTNS